MNQDSLNESEGAFPPVKKKMRPAPATTTPTEEVAKRKGTLYITVGPQCAGKTTILKQIFGRSFHKNEEGVSSSLTQEEASAAGVDITIDDQALVYVPVPPSYFLANSSGACTTTAAYPALTDVIYGKMICERIYDEGNEELVSVVRRLGGLLSAEEFRSRLQGNSNSTQEGDARTARDDLVEAVEELMRSQPSPKLETEEGGVINQTAAISLPETIDLFIVESIFRLRPLSIIQRMSNEQPDPHGNATSSSSSSETTSETKMSQNSTSLSAETMSALDQALHLLKTHAMDPHIHAEAAPLSWGNTNTRPREFQSALEAASLSDRPVEFIAFGGREASEMIRDHVSRREYRRMDRDGKGDDSAAAIPSAETTVKDEIAASEGEDCTEERSLLCLPKVDRRTLLARNLQRFLRTGRYIPSNAIAGAMVRVESLLASAAAEANKEHKDRSKEDAGGEKEADKISTSNASEAAEANKAHPKENAERETEMKKMSMSRAKFRLDFELAKMAGYRLNADRTVSATRQFSTRANNGDGNHGSRNNYHSGRGDNRQWQQSERYYGGRGRSYHSGRGGGRGRFSSRPPNNNHWNRSGQDYDGKGGGRGRSDSRPLGNSHWDRSGQDRTYGPSGRGYDQSQQRRGEGRGNNSSHGGSQGFDRSNGRGPGGGRGWDDRQRSSGGRSGQYRGRGRARWGD